MDWLKEKMRDKTRDELHTSLCSIELDAHVLEEGLTVSVIRWYGRIASHFQEGGEKMS